MIARRWTTPVLAALSTLLCTPASAAETWRSRGYGWFLSRGILYHRAGTVCWADPDKAAGGEPFARQVERSDGAIGLTAVVKGETVYPFDRVARLPSACAKPDTSDAAAVEAIAELMERYYPGGAARGIDLGQRRAAMRRALGTAPSHDHFAAATAFLAGLNDPHVDLEATIGGTVRRLVKSEGATLDAVNARGGDRPERRWLHNWREGIETRILGGGGHVSANSRVIWGMRGKVGYLAIVTMGGFDPAADDATAPLDRALDSAMRGFAGATAVVVDVSNNRGGYDSIARRIAARFADRPRVTMTKRPFGADADAQPIVVVPSSGRPSYHGPIWLLTSDITVSAGETFSQMMRAMPQVIHAGTATRGAFSDQFSIPLANGWRFAMPMESYASPDGMSLEGHPLEPAVRLDLYPKAALDHGHAVAVTGLIDALDRGTAPTHD